MTRRFAVTLAGAVWLTLVPIVSRSAVDSTAVGPPQGIPVTEPSRLTAIAAGAALATRVDGDPFRGRRDIFEYLLNHRPFTTQVIQSLRFPRLRVWQTPEGLAIDER